jgi:hypothetical protein
MRQPALWSVLVRPIDQAIENQLADQGGLQSMRPAIGPSPTDDLPLIAVQLDQTNT